MIWSVRQNASASLLYITSTATVAMAVEQQQQQYQMLYVNDHKGITVLQKLLV